MYPRATLGGLGVPKGGSQARLIFGLPKRLRGKNNPSSAVMLKRMSTSCGPFLIPKPHGFGPRGFRCTGKGVECPHWLAPFPAGACQRLTVVSGAKQGQPTRPQPDRLPGDEPQRCHTEHTVPRLGRATSLPTSCVPLASVHPSPHTEGLGPPLACQRPPRVCDRVIETLL